MTGTISPDVARAAVALRRSHPAASALEVLDTCMRQRVGSLQDFGPAIEPGSAFGQLLAEVFAIGEAVQNWALCQEPGTSADVVARLHSLWAAEVLTKFAARYGLRA